MEQLTGVAAILRFPMPELEEDESDDEEKADWCKCYSIIFIFNSIIET